PGHHGYEAGRGIRFAGINQKDIGRADAGVLEPDYRVHPDELRWHVPVLAYLRPIDLRMQQSSEDRVRAGSAGEDRQAPDLCLSQYKFRLGVTEAFQRPISPPVATFLRAKLEVIRATPGRRDRTVEWRVSYALGSP